MSSESSSFDEQLESIYLLACVLSGPDSADELVRRAYSKASDVRSEGHPENPLGGLVRHLADLRNVEPPASNESPSPASDPTPPSDPLRNEMGNELLKRHLPTAFAACTADTRFVLTLDVLGVSDDTLTHGLGLPDAGAETVRIDAQRRLQAALRDILTDGEEIVVRARAGDSCLTDALKNMLERRFPDVPAALRTEIHSLLQNASQESRSVKQTEKEKDARGRAVFRNLGASQHWWTTIALLLLATATVYGLLKIQSLSSAPKSNVVTRSVAVADTLGTSNSVANPDSAQRHLRTVWNRRVTVPKIVNASFSGFERARINEETAVPVFGYADNQVDERIVIFAYTYALLDRLASDLSLSTDLRQSLRDDARVIEAPSECASAVLWRNRDDIFIAVATHLSVEALRDRIKR